MVTNGGESNIGLLLINSCSSIGDSVKAKSNVISSCVKFDCYPVITVSSESSIFSRNFSLFMECNIFCGIVEEDNPNFSGQQNISLHGIIFIPGW